MRVLKCQLQSFEVLTEVAMQDDQRVKFYSGLPNFSTLKAVFEFVSPEQSTLSKLSPFQQFMMVLLKLRMNLPMKDLAYRFNVSVATVSRVWLKRMVRMVLL